MGKDGKLTRRQVVRATTAGMAALWLGGGYVAKGPTSARAEEPPPPPTADEWNALAEIALKEVRTAGSTYGDIRILHLTKQDVVGRDRRIHQIGDVDDLGFGVRVLHRGAWGFAASGVLEPAEVRRVARLAVEIAKGSSALTKDPVKLAEEPVHRDVVKTAFEIDPFEVPLEKKAALLEEIMEALHADERIKRSHATLWAQRDRKLFASTEGTHLRFDLLATNGWYQGTATLEGRFANRSFSTTYLRKGWELVEGTDLVGEAPRVAAQAIEKANAPAVAPGAYDLVLDPAHLALTIHETCGHPTELDRALGYEANFAGTSFLTPDKLGHFRYGSKHVNLVADNTEPETLAATGYDDDGVAGQQMGHRARGDLRRVRHQSGGRP